MERNKLTNYPLAVFHDTESVKEMKLQWAWLAVWSLVPWASIYLEHSSYQYLQMNTSNCYPRVLWDASPSHSFLFPSLNFCELFSTFLSYLDKIREIFNPLMILLTNGFKCKIHQIHCLPLHQNANNLCHKIMVFKFFYFRLFYIFNIF